MSFKEIKKFEDYRDSMPMSDILTFARIGFACQQILENENLLDLVQEMITCPIDLEKH